MYESKKGDGKRKKGSRIIFFFCRLLQVREANLTTCDHKKQPHNHTPDLMHLSPDHLAFHLIAGPSPLAAVLFITVSTSIFTSVMHTLSR